jgi:hypothetical protein
MAYELGAGLGIALFGLILTRSYTSSIVLPGGIEGAAAEQASSSISEAIKLAQSLPAIPAQSLLKRRRRRLFMRTASCWRRLASCSAGGRDCVVWQKRLSN